MAQQLRERSRVLVEAQVLNVTRYGDKDVITLGIVGSGAHNSSDQEDILDRPKILIYSHHVKEVLEEPFKVGDLVTYVPYSISTPNLAPNHQGTILWIHETDCVIQWSDTKTKSIIPLANIKKITT